MKILSGKESLVIWSASCCHNPRRPPQSCALQVQKVDSEYCQSTTCCPSVIPAALSLTMCHSKRCLCIVINLHQSQILVSVMLLLGQLAYSLCSHIKALKSNTTFDAEKPTEYACQNVTKPLSCSCHMHLVTCNRKYFYSKSNSIKTGRQ